MTTGDERPNLAVRSNLMLDADDRIRHWWVFAPGDLFHELRYLEGKDMWNTQNWRRDLSRGQQHEFEQYIRCNRCGRTCAGNCEPER
jgi:hypothetical protein